MRSPAGLGTPARRARKRAAATVVDALDGALPCICVDTWYCIHLICLGKTMPPRATLLPGTLDVLVLKAISLGPLHGYGVLLRIEQITRGALLVEQGALYPALFRLEQQGLLATAWGVSDNNRRAKFYRLTPTGRRRLRAKHANWQQLADAMAAALDTRPGEV
ncbi:MAG: PadR family transcriptional regulator [Spirochaetaceae bacterium]|nr:PadR family transcriptional regulator [Spirochaetaceae bacterium]